MSPGDVTPVVFGITLPSAGTWMAIYLALLIAWTCVMFGFWAYWADLGDRQLADPRLREKMNLGVGVSPLGSRIRPTIERLAEPERSRARRCYAVLNGVLAAILTAAFITIGAYLVLVT